jgi:hypothetical protein
MVQQGGHGMLELDLGFWPLLWMLYFCTPRVVINGAMERRSWGKHQIPLPAGVYQLSVSFPYGLMSNAGSAHLQQVQIMPGCATGVTYRAPFFIFFGGSIWQLPPRPAGAMAYPR